MHFRAAVACLGVLAATGCPGCTVTETFENGALASRSFGFVVRSAPSCGEDSTASRSRVFGLGVGAGGMTLGYRREALVCLPPGCKAVFLVEDAAEAVALRELVGDPAALCTRSLEDVVEVGRGGNP
jgi:hypothetical protein